MEAIICDTGPSTTKVSVPSGAWHAEGLTFLAELWLALLDSGQHHVTTGSGGQTVQATADASNCDDVQVLGT